MQKTVYVCVENMLVCYENTPMQKIRGIIFCFCRCAFTSYINTLVYIGFKFQIQVHFQKTHKKQTISNEEVAIILRWLLWPVELELKRYIWCPLYSIFSLCLSVSHNHLHMLLFDCEWMLFIFIFNASIYILFFSFVHSSLSVRSSSHLCNGYAFKTRGSIDHRTHTFDVRHFYYKISKNLKVQIA